MNDISAMGIVSLALPFSYKVHDAIMEEDKDYQYFSKKGESLFIHVMAASVMMTIIELDDDYYALYYNEIVNRLEVHYSSLRSVCDDFNEFVRLNYCKC
ncbi:hypothetical protein M6D81_12005 [Paenibacillus sp. J5C_2022]|uniref:hypothetical protein n=1 Tax=Paenibacillus sp. J5C2022 TaxID=2977129 RepID=UPI0021D017FD|nr:hypothetical protein [Paenibacillus sp. J5C2022]MCU6709429.1 hypothetical protein [Paenibacillus sp. J5C2022]